MFNKLISYGLFGFLTTIINIISFSIFGLLNIDYKMSTVLSWILAVIFAYITNKKYVFKSTLKNKKKTLREFIIFILARFISLGIELILMIILIDKICINNIISKMISTIIVIILNYFISDFFIFNKQKQGL